MTVLAGMGAMYTRQREHLNFYNGINVSTPTAVINFEILDIESKVIDSEKCYTV